MISILLPTTGRPNMAERAVHSIRATTEGAEIVAAVDCDPESAEALAPLVDKLLVANHYRGCSQAWNDCLAEAEGDPIVFGADDLIFQPGWLEAALELLEPGGFVGFNDGHWNGDRDFSTHYLMSRRFICEVLGGVVAWPQYKHSFNDLETTERARAAGRYAWAADAHVPHVHWLFGDRPKDDTDSRRLPDHAADQRHYDERRAAGFPNDYEPRIEC